MRPIVGTSNGAGVRRAAIVIGLTVVGCAPLVWTKPGGTQSEFAEDRYACLQESQQRQGRAGEQVRRRCR